MNKRKVFSVLAVVVALIVGAITIFMLLNGDKETIKEKEVPKTSVKPTKSKIGSFGDTDSINHKKTTSVGSEDGKGSDGSSKGSEDGKKSDDNSDIVSAIDSENSSKTADKPGKVVTKKQDTYTDEVSVSTSNSNSISVAVDNGTSDNEAVESTKETSKVVDTEDALKDLKQNKLSKKLKSVYAKYGVRVFGSSTGGMYTIDESVQHSFGTTDGNYFIVKISDDAKTYAIASEVVDKLGAPGDKEKILSAMKKSISSKETIDLGKKGYVRADSNSVAVRW